MKRPRRAVDAVHAASGNDSEESAASAMDQDDVPAVPEVQQPEHSSVKRKHLSAQELRSMNQGVELFKSNAFQLQIASLLPNVSPKEKHVASISKLLHDVHAHIMAMEPVASQHPLHAAKKMQKRGVAVPYPLPLPTEDTNWTVAFEKPREITVVGSWANKVAVKQPDGLPFKIDLALEMPSTLFQEKDYLNLRFFHKRAFYLAVLAASFTKSDLPVDLQFACPDGDTRETVLVLKPCPGLTKLNAVVHVLPVLGSSAPISPHRLSPSHANLRTPSGENFPTPTYNCTLARARLSRPLLLAVYRWAQTAPAYADALRLLRVWAHQRGFGAGTRQGTVLGFARGEWWACVLGVLLSGEEPRPQARKNSKKLLGRGLSSYQFFRAALDFVATRDFVKEPVFMQCAADAAPPFDRDQFIIAEKPVFVDPTSTVNLLSAVALGALDLLKHDARTTLQLLDTTTSEPFHAVFMTDMRCLHTRFDLVLRVNLSSPKTRQISPGQDIDTGSRQLSLLAAIPDLLRRALGDRARIVAPLRGSCAPRDISQARSTADTYMLIGILLDAASALRLVDHGPLADDPGVAAFREFWGEKAELRRFKDGRIVEAVVWDNDERRLIPLRIAQHVLAHHVGLETSDVQLLSARYDSLLAAPAEAVRRRGAKDEQSGWRAALGAMDELVKALKGLDPARGVPLSLVTASPSSEGLRYCAPLAPLPVPTDPRQFARLPECMRHVEPLDITLQFEQSGRWPDDLAAIHKMKLIFFERLASALVHAAHGTIARIVLDPEESGSLIRDNAALEVLVPAGFAFRARIYHNREETLLRRILEDKPRLGAAPPTPREQVHARVALELHRRVFIARPRHHTAVVALHHMRPVFAPTARLLKRWLAAHMLAPHVPPEAAELIAAAVCVRDAPGSPGAGLARALVLLRDWDFYAAPLAVPLYAAGEEGAAHRDVLFPGDQWESATKAFAARRGADPALSRAAWCIVTEHDTDGTAWTAERPSRLVADRIRAVAAATSKYMEEALERGQLEMRMVFTHPMRDYDFLVHIDPRVLPRYYQHVHADPAVWASGAVPVPALTFDAAVTGPLVDFDPAAMFYADLRRVYGSVAEFFHDPLGGAVIGGVWDPAVLQRRAFKVLLGFNSVVSPDKGGKKDAVTLNIDAVLAEIQTLGAGLVTKIVQQTRA